MISIKVKLSYYIKVGTFLELSQNSANLEARCPFCNNMEFNLKDVNPDEKVRECKPRF